jgi:hypothetical protein
MRTLDARRISFGAALFVILAIIAAGCAPSASPTQAPAPTAVPPQVQGTTPQPAPTSSGEPTSSGQRVNGTVKSVSSGKITLTDGTTLTLAPDTQIITVQPATSADLQPNLYVAITAQRQSDGSLLASAVNIFAESQRGLGAGQRPLAGGNLMTNATISTVTGDTFIATFPGGDATVKVAPDAKIQRFVSGGPQDITNGRTLSAFVVNGVVRSISLQ